MTTFAGMAATGLALAASLLSAMALYAGSPNCRWPRGRRLRGIGPLAGAALAALALGLWIWQLGVGAGLCAMLAAWMLPLMALPYLAALSGPAGGNGAEAG